MTLETTLREMASINLFLAQSEIADGDDPNSIMLAIDHIQKALACLTVIAPEVGASLDDASEEAA
jgi:hypothetical protein